MFQFPSDLFRYSPMDHVAMLDFQEMLDDDCD